MIMNKARRIKHPTKVPTTSAEFQGLMIPPHCNANIKQIIELNNVTRPGRSICKKISLQDAGVGFADAGEWKVKNRIMRTIKPTGRLI